MKKGKEFRGMGPEREAIVEADDAYKYALDRCLNWSPADQQRFGDTLVEWFYSGNWLALD